MSYEQRLPPAYLTESEATTTSMTTYESHLCRKMGCPERATVDGFCEEHANSTYIDDYRG